MPDGSVVHATVTLGRVLPNAVFATATKRVVSPMAVGDQVAGVICR